MLYHIVTISLGSFMSNYIIYCVIILDDIILLYSLLIKSDVAPDLNLLEQSLRSPSPTQQMLHVYFITTMVGKQNLHSEMQQ